ncbi:MAG: Flp pilus assembly complex ATPase component TadA [Candidatus Schekmanbacteria bacterium]|nr:Flp pilus assembly complex ATPase component TadA [Candidatus Schekmanbacteria bacterium]
MENQTFKPLGQRLIEQGVISKAQLDLALEEQKRTGDYLGEILQRLGFVTEAQLTFCLADRIGAASIKLKTVSIPSEALKLVPETFARSHRLIPVNLVNNLLTVAMVDTVDVVTIDELRRLTKCHIEVKSATHGDILKAIEKYYAEEVVDEDIEKIITEAEKISADKKEDESLAVPIIKLVEQILYRGIKMGATDIHIEPDELVMRTRYRIDGVMQQGPSFPKKLQSAIITRIKIISDLNVSESRIPQDGKTRYTIGQKKIDMRVSTLPAIFGEAIVIRILDRAKVLVGLANLGFFDKDRAIFNDLIERPNGIILVTGPTGSGKTTTLYTALGSINSLEKTVITLEDPVEYELSTIRQSQINVKAGMTFAAGLRAILRQDPDVILIGEMRDKETAEMAVRAALTGHLVFSTLHTNDAPKAIPRLVDMGITPLLISSSVIAIIAQRLVRIICEDCKVEGEPNMQLVKKFNLEERLDFSQPFYKGKGCPVCNNIGFKGRRAIFEILVMNAEISKLIINDIDPDKVRAVASQSGMRSMLDDGLVKVQAGMTTLDEVLRVVF